MNRKESCLVKHIVKLTSLLIAVMLTALASAESAPDVHAIAQKVDSRYNHLHTLEAQFTEAYQGAGMDRTESGTLWLKKPGKMRWEYRSPKEKLFLSDGKNVWFYVPGDQQVRRSALRELDDLRSPLAFLLGKTKLEKELPGLSFAPDVKPMTSGNLVLRGVPKAVSDQVSQVILEVTPGGEIERILMEGTDGSVTEYRFSEQRADAEIAEQRFHFAPPPGVEVIQQKLGQ